VTTELLVVLRLHGAEFDPDKFASAFDFEPNAVFKKGEKDRRGRVEVNGALNWNLGNAETTEDLESLLLEFFREEKPMLLALPGYGGEAKIDIGLLVGSRERYVTSVAFSPQVMEAASALGVTLKVTGYPTSSD
jgi:hypothetical protein